MTTTPTPRADERREARRRRVVLLVLVIAVATVLGGFGARAVAFAIAPSAPVPPGAVDDTSATVHYRGDWSSRSIVGFIHKSDHLSATTGASATYRFTGSQLALYGGVGPASGIATVAIDGGPAYEVDFFGRHDAGGRLLWVSAPLAGAAHTVTVRVAGEHRDDSTGTAVDLDAFRVLQNATTRAAAGDGDITWSSGWSTSGPARSTSSGSLEFDLDGRAAILSGSATTGTVSVDGGAAEPLAPGDGVLWASGALRGGRHRVVVRLTGAASVASATVLRDVLATPVATSAVRTSHGWRTFTGNPVVGKNWGTAFDLSAMRQNGLYRVWFSWRPKLAIAYVQSVDGISWTAPKIVLAARPGTWESDVNRPSVIIGPSGAYQMWYTGQTDVASALGYATSPDGLHWTRPRSTPVMTPQGWEQPSVMNSSVLWDPDMHRYRMWFSGGQTQEPNAIGYATSANGVDWTRYSTSPVFQNDPAHAWERNRVAGIQVIRQSDKSLLAFYIGYRDILTAAIGVSRSTDGIHWSHELAKPLIAAVPKTWDCDAVYKPYALWDATDDEWRLWFNGRCGGDEQLGMAVHRGASLF